MRIPRTLHRAAFFLALAVFLTALVKPRTANAHPRQQQAQLTASSSNLNFGSIQVGSYQALNETLTNSSRSADITISRATITGTGFSMSGLQPPIVLTPGQRYTFSVTFTPTTTGRDSGKISITSNASSPVLAITLTGTGSAPPPPPAGGLSVSPTTINFNNVNVGSYGTQTGTITATGSSVIVNSGTVSNSAFSIGGLLFPVTIQAGQQAQFTVTFTPQTSGLVTGTVSFASNAANSPTTASLTGTGVAASYSVSLSWNESPSQNITGYNVYRGNTSGGPYSKITPQPDPNTTYSDSSVSDNQTYYYVTTAINSSGQESGYSNETQAVVP